MQYRTILIRTDASDAEIELALGPVLRPQHPEVQIGLGDLTVLDSVAYTRWHKEDLANALESAGYEANEHNMEALEERMDSLEDMQVSDGWETLDHLIQMAAEDNDLYTQEDDAEEYDI